MLMAANSLRNRAYIACLYETGVRRHELVALKLKHVKATDDHFTLWFGKVKVTGEEHEGFVADGARTLRDWLKEHPSRDDPEAPLFPTYSGEHLGQVSSWKIIGSTARRAGITKRVWPHLLRHSRATHLLQMGTPEATVKALLGWSPESAMLGRYSHLTSRGAKASYFKSIGRKEPQDAHVEKVNFDVTTVGVTRPVMARPPAFAGPTPDSRPPMMVGDTEMEILAQEVARALKAEYDARPGPAWTGVSAEAYNALVIEVARMKGELEKLQTVRLKVEAVESLQPSPHGVKLDGREYPAPCS